MCAVLCCAVLFRNVLCCGALCAWIPCVRHGCLCCGRQRAQTPTEELAQALASTPALASALDRLSEWAQTPTLSHALALTQTNAKSSFGHHNQRQHRHVYQCGQWTKHQMAHETHLGPGPYPHSPPTQPLHTCAGIQAHSMMTPTDDAQTARANTNSCIDLTACGAETIAVHTGSNASTRCKVRLVLRLSFTM